MFRFLNKKLLYTVNYGKQINIKATKIMRIYLHLLAAFFLFFAGSIYANTQTGKNA